MKNINWEEFKKGNIEVGCKTEELAKDFLAKCREQGIVWSDGDRINIEKSQWHKHQEGTLYGVWSAKELFHSGGLYFGKVEEKESYKYFIEWSDNSFQSNQPQLTFTDLIIQRKPKQTWIGGAYIVEVDEDNNIRIRYKNCKSDLGTEIPIDCNDVLYTLKSEPVTVSFSEAMKECEDNSNKAMRSLVSHKEYRIYEGGFKLFIRYKEEWVNHDLGYNEIKGEWIIYEI